jgi:hypothetical protein
MRRRHVACERVFVDYAVATLEVFDPPRPARARAAQIFVAALGASGVCALAVAATHAR